MKEYSVIHPTQKLVTIDDQSSLGTLRANVYLGTSHINLLKAYVELAWLETVACVLG